MKRYEDQRVLVRRCQRDSCGRGDLLGSVIRRPGPWSYLPGILTSPKSTNSRCPPPKFTVIIPRKTWVWKAGHTTVPGFPATITGSPFCRGSGCPPLMRVSCVNKASFPFLVVAAWLAPSRCYYCSGPSVLAHQAIICRRKALMLCCNSANCRCTSARRPSIC